MYIAKKPCNFGGQRFICGGKIAEELVDKAQASKLVKIGLIEHVPDEATQTAITPPEVPGEENPQGDTGDAAEGVKQPDNGQQDKPGENEAATEVAQAAAQPAEAKPKAGQNKAAATTHRNGGNGGRK